MDSGNTSPGLCSIISYRDYQGGQLCLRAASQDSTCNLFGRLHSCPGDFVLFHSGLILQFNANVDGSCGSFVSFLGQSVSEWYFKMMSGYILRNKRVFTVWRSAQCLHAQGKNQCNLDNLASIRQVVAKEEWQQHIRDAASNRFKQLQLDALKMKSWKPSAVPLPIDGQKPMSPSSCHS